MRENIKTIKNGVTALAVGLFVVVVFLSSLDGTTAPGDRAVDETVSSWGHFNSTDHAPKGCWSGDAPKDMAGKMPGHVWATLPGGKTGVFGPVWVDKALNQQFGKEKTFGLTVMGFCR